MHSRTNNTYCTLITQDPMHNFIKQTNNLIEIVDSDGIDGFSNEHLLHVPDHARFDIQFHETTHKLTEIVDILMA